MKIEAVQAALASVVPTGKQLVFVVSFAVTSFLAGVGFMTSASDYSGLPETVDSLVHNVSVNTSAIEDLEDAVEIASRDRARMMCLLEITATGEVVLAQQLNSRCGS